MYTHVSLIQLSLLFRGTELNCMLWGDYAEQFTELQKSCSDVGLVIQLGRCKCKMLLGVPNYLCTMERKAL